jgi:hypothetical protein
MLEHGPARRHKRAPISAFRADRITLALMGRALLAVFVFSMVLLISLLMRPPVGRTSRGDRSTNSAIWKVGFRRQSMRNEKRAPIVNANYKSLEDRNAPALPSVADVDSGG